MEKKHFQFINEFIKIDFLYQMAIRSATFLMAICLVGLMSSALSFELNKIQHHIKRPSIFQSTINPQTECQNPSLYEYINRFSLPLQDVNNLLTNQFSRNQIQNFQSSNKLMLFNIISVSKLLSNDQSESFTGPFKALVYNDNIEFTISYQLNISEGTIKKNHTFSGVTKVSNVSITYEKQFKLETGGFVINSATVKFDVNSMTSTFNPSPNKAELESFNTAIKGNTKSLFTTLTNFYSSDIVKQSMQSNSKGEHLSKVYLENPYIYNFYLTNINIDVSTVSFSTKNSSLTSGMTGKLPQGNTFCSQFVPDFTNTGASMFISKEFVQNFVGYNVATYPGWKNLRIDQKSFRSDLLQWELLDLSFVVDGLWNDLGQYLQNQIYFRCNVQDQVSTRFEADKNRLHQTMLWSCQGFVKLNETTQQQVLDFAPRIDHITNIQISRGSLSIYVNELQVIDCQFKDVLSLNGQAKYTVNQNGASLAIKLMDSVFNDFRVYPIGNRFQVNSNAKSLKVEDAGNGLWII